MNVEHRTGHSPLGSHDSRVSKIIQQNMARNPLQELLHPTADPFNHRARSGSVYNEPQMVYGHVTQSVPFFGWYRVELDGQKGDIGCFRVRSNASPLGPIAFETILPGQRVLVKYWPGISVGCIEGVASSSIYDAYAFCPGWLQQGAGTGVFRNAAHNQGLKLTDGGGILDFSVGSPLDSLLLDMGWTYSLGATFMLNPFMIQMRISEVCGLWLNWFDKTTRLAGKTMEIFSPAQLFFAGSDQSEPYAEQLGIVYPWEGAGYLASVGETGVTTPDGQVWYKEMMGTYDRAKSDQKVKPFSRSTVYGGYLGQGGLEIVEAPGVGATRNTPEHRPTALSLVSKTLDGDIILQGAHSVGMVKDVIVPAAHRLKAAPDPQGDTSKGQSPNYRAAGVGSGGVAHSVQGALSDTSTAVDDELAYLIGWKTVHPFYYHKKDFHLSQPSESVFGRSQDRVDYSPIAAGQDMAKPTPIQLNIDHRYGMVNYYRRRSFVLLRPDGSVDIGDGSGAFLGLRDGKIKLHAPDGIEIMSGGRSVWMMGELSATTHKSMDLVSANGDLRLGAAEGNLQAIGKSVLLESTDTDNSFDYDQKVGEDVVSTGIILKSKTAIVSHSDSIYLRSGVGNSDKGDIVLDASKREGSLVVHAKQVTNFTSQGMTMWIGNIDQGTFDVLHTLGRRSSIIGNQLVVDGNVAVIGDNRQVLLDGSIVSTGSISCAQGMADKSGAVGKVPDDYADKLNDQTDKAKETLDDSKDQGKDSYQEYFTDGIYSENRPGNTDLVDQIGFSFRDDDSQQQYGSSGLVIDEPRWQRWLRLGLASGGQSWQQNPLPYQNKELFPYPGRKAWTENEVLEQTAASDVMNYGNGRSSDRTDQTGSAKPGDQTRVTMLGNFKVLIG